MEFYHRELEKEKRQHFKAIITDVKNHGLFVELTDSLAFGMIHISTLDDDFYHPNAEGTALIGRRKQRSFALGQTIVVQVERVDRFKRQIDFRAILSDQRDLGKKPGKPFKGRRKPTARKESPSSRASAKSAPGKQAAEKVITKRPKKVKRKRKN